MKRLVTKKLAKFFINPPQWIWDCGQHRRITKVLSWFYKKEIKTMKQKDYMDYTHEEDVILHIVCLGQV